MFRQAQNQSLAIFENYKRLYWKNPFRILDKKLWKDNSTRGLIKKNYVVAKCIYVTWSFNILVERELIDVTGSFFVFKTHNTSDLKFINIEVTKPSFKRGNF